MLFFPPQKVRSQRNLQNWCLHFFSLEKKMRDLLGIKREIVITVCVQSIYQLYRPSFGFEGDSFCLYFCISSPIPCRPKKPLAFQLPKNKSRRCLRAVNNCFKGPRKALETKNPPTSGENLYKPASPQKTQCLQGLVDGPEHVDAATPGTTRDTADGLEPWTCQNHPKFLKKSRNKS